jgi:hypothetical protein
VIGTTEELLASGADSRLVIDPQTGLNRYGCRFRPEPGLIDLGSCTASTVSELAFAAAERLALRWPHSPSPDLVEASYEAIRSRLRAHLLVADPAADIALTPSGTDAEYVALAVARHAGDPRICNIVIAPDEVGSGTVSAAAAHHFDVLTPSGAERTPGTPLDPTWAATTTVRCVHVRDRAGGFRPIEEIDAEVSGAVDRSIAEGASVLVHIVAHSKTGVHAPSLDAVVALQDRHSDRVHVVVDAAQGRISRRGLRGALGRGWMVILTGSKFYGGPPFAGAVIVPDRYVDTLPTMPAVPGLRDYFVRAQAPATWTSWRAGLGDGPNLGLLMRWEAALAEFDRYYEIDPATRLAVLRAFEGSAPEALGAVPSVDIEVLGAPIVDDSTERLLESKKTVFTFTVTSDGRPLAADALRTLQGELRRPAGGRPIQTGQPVVVGPDKPAMLRIALGAPLIARYAASTAIEREVRSDLDWLAHRLSLALDPGAPG